MIVLTLALCAYLVFFYPRVRVFCTTNDRVYQAFAENIESFKNFFPPVSSPTTIEATRFSVPNDREYVVRADYWSDPEAKSLMFYVPVLEAYSSLTTGTEGYLYSTEVSDYWKDTYKLTRLSEDIYCYHD